MKEKILILTPRLSDGGIEKVASNLSMGLSGVEHKILALYGNEKKTYEFNTPPDVLNVKLRKGLAGKVFSTIKRIIQVRKYVKNNNIDVLVSMGETCNLISMLTGTSARKVLTIHSQLSIEAKTKGRYGKIQIALAKILYGRADSIIAVSKVVKDDVENELNVKDVSVVYNGHDLDYIREKANFDLPIIPNSDAIIVGRITYAKGHWFLLRALARVKEEYPDFILTVLGTIENIDLYQKLTRIIKRLDLEKNVKFIDYTDNPYPYINSSKFLVQSSVYEGFPSVVIEALSLGVPVLTTNCGGATELITNGLTPSQLNDGMYVGKLGIISSHIGYEILDSEPLTTLEIEFSNSIIRMMKGGFDADELSAATNEFSLTKMANRYMDIINAK
ncbi:glycosyltransferase [Vibrio cyclitrophicus]